jgi:unsaturated rhamnogalacturonyl hydrolase
VEQTQIIAGILQDGNGFITGVSTMTDPWSLEMYLGVPVEDDVNYGVGAVILSLIETSGLPRVSA